VLNGRSYQLIPRELATDTWGGMYLTVSAPGGPSFCEGGSSLKGVRGFAQQRQGGCEMREELRGGR